MLFGTDIAVAIADAVDIAGDVAVFVFVANLVDIAGDVAVAATAVATTTVFSTAVDCKHYLLVLIECC